MQAVVDFVARCLAAKAAAQIGTVIIKTLTKEEFDNIEAKATSTLYIVTDGNKVTLYFGDAKLSSGGSRSGFASLTSINVNRAITGDATFEELGG